MIGSEPHPSPSASRAHVIAAFAAVYLIWGSTYLAIRFAVTTIPPFLMGALRFLVSGVILYAWARHRGASAPSRAQWRASAITGVLLLVGGNGAVIWAEQRVASGMVALIVAIVPLWMVLLDWLRPGGLRPRPPVFAGLGLGLAGLVLLLGPDAVSKHGSAGVDVAAALVPVLGSLFWALGSILSRHLPRPDSAQLSTGMQMLAGGAVFLVVSALAAEPAQFRPAAVALPSMVGLGYLIVFGSLIGYTAYVYLLRASTPAKVSTYAYVNPVVAVMLGWAFASEPFTGRMLAAAAVILGGVALITLASGPSPLPGSGRTPPAAASRREHDGSPFSEPHGLGAD